MQDRKELVAKAILNMGFLTFSVSAGILDQGVVVATVSVSADDFVREEDVIASLPGDLQSSVRVVFSEGPVVHDLESFGGMWMRWSGGNECTSGFTVRKVATTTYGVATAGHCINDMQTINHPGHGVHNLTGMPKEHYGSFGDDQWHTTAVADFDDFYASSTIVRDVASYEHHTEISVGEEICYFGRTNTDMVCDLLVENPNQMCVNDGKMSDRLVRMDQSGNLDDGDSGGPWFFGTKAYGLTKGLCEPEHFNKAVFSTVSRLVDAIGVEIVCGVPCP